MISICKDEAIKRLGEFYTDGFQKTDRLDSSIHKRGTNR